MEENKILEFVKEFNSELEESNTDYTPYNYLQYSNDGTVESISLREMVMFDDQNNFYEFLVANCSSTIVLALENVLNKAKKYLWKEVNKFVEEFLEDNGIGTYELLPKSNYTWNLTVNEEHYDLVSDLDDGFARIFYGCKLQIETFD